MSSPAYLGIDLGTGGVRAVAVTAAGRVLATGSAAFAKSPSASPAGWHEQQGDDWWRCTVEAIRTVVGELDRQGLSAAILRAASVDGTSGTIIGLDADGKPVRPGIMYNDGRAVDEAKELNAIVAESLRDSESRVAERRGYCDIAASYAIAKIRWLQRHEPQHFQRVAWFAHQADYIAFQLTGTPRISDYSNALKTGFDLVANAWPAWLISQKEMHRRLPRIVAPGAVIGTLRRDIAAQLGLPAGLPVAAGATDGTAGFLASGAAQVGDDNTTLGTTLVFKRLARQPASDPQGLVYSHKLPGLSPDAPSLWLPGAASNTGCEWMSMQFPGADFKQLDAQAAALLPCEVLAHPLARTGERFPFLDPRATGFCAPAVTDPLLRYAAHLQGVAFVERLCYEALDQAAGITGRDVYATGGGSRSDVWMQLRADVTGRVYHRPACPESAFGAAVLAAANDLGGLWPTIRSMVRIEKTFHPDPLKRARYDALHERFAMLLGALVQPGSNSL